MAAPSPSAVETIVGSTGDDAVTLSTTVSGGSFDLGTGTDTLNLANGGNTLTVSGTIETVVGGSGNDLITVGSAVTGLTYDLGGRYRGPTGALQRGAQHHHCGRN